MSYNSPNFKKKKNKGFDSEKTLFGAFIGMWGLAIILNLAFWGFIIWVVVQLLQHFGVI